MQVRYRIRSLSPVYPSLTSHPSKRKFHTRWIVLTSDSRPLSKCQVVHYRHSVLIFFYSAVFLYFLNYMKRYRNNSYFTLRSSLHDKIIIYPWIKGKPLTFQHFQTHFREVQHSKQLIGCREFNEGHR